MRLFIAEKPSLARAIAENLGKGKKGNGCITLNGGEDVVTWCFGHILEQCDPSAYDEKYKKWNLDDLPIIPKTWKLSVKKDAKDQFKVIKDLIGKADYIVNAGDPDREGQLLVDEVLEYCHNSKPVKRILLNALDSKSVKQALHDLRDNADFVGLKNSARARSEADWLVGMNLTRAFTIKAREAGYDSVVSVGRVQTPTMALVVRREKQIKSFHSVTHYLTEVLWKHENGTVATKWAMRKDMDGLDPEGHLLSKTIAEGMLQKLRAVAGSGTGAQIQKVEKKKKQDGQRLPYSLSTLQVEAGRKYGYSPQQVLDTMQELYEKTYTTYPRSDCEYLPTNQLADAPEVLGMLKTNVPALAEFIPQADPKIVSRAWNDKKISAHHAIVPTSVPVSFAALTEIQQRLYLMVARAYLAQFFPIHTYLATKIAVSCADELFVGTGKTILENGWRALYQKEKNDSDEESAVLPEVSEGDSVAFQDAKIKEAQTKPPKRFTEATLLQAMKEIHKYVKEKDLSPELKECKGIGTEATRAGIIERLKSAGFVSVSKKELLPTEKAEMAVSILPESLTYPDTTAVWEKELDEIVNQTTDLPAFLEKQEGKIRSILEVAKKAAIPAPKNAAICPNCGKPLRRRKGKNGFFWGCSGYPDCKTTFPDAKGKPDFAAKKKSSAATGKTATCPTCGKQLRQIKGSYGVFWGCEDRNCKTTFNDYADKPVIVKCPSCGKGYLHRYESKKKKGSYYWSCSAHCKTFLNDKDGLPDVDGWKAKQKG